MAHVKKIAVHDEGGTWLLTERQLARFLTEYALGGHPSLDDYGTYVGQSLTLVYMRREEARNHVMSNAELCDAIPGRDRSLLKEAEYAEDGSLLPSKD